MVSTEINSTVVLPSFQRQATENPGVVHQNQKPITEFQEFCDAVVVYKVVENDVSMRVKASHTVIFWFRILQLMLLSDVHRLIPVHCFPPKMSLFFK